MNRRNLADGQDHKTSPQLHHRRTSTVTVTLSPDLWEDINSAERHFDGKRPPRSMRSSFADVVAILARPRPHVVKILVVGLVLVVILTWTSFSMSHSASSLSSYSPFGSRKPKRPTTNSPSATEDSPSGHPIDTLIRRADEQYDDFLSKQTHNVEAAAKAYRDRRGRHPPPGFDVWFDFAQKRNAIMVEDFFDQIYHDLGPFWGVDPHQMRQEGKRSEMVISIRNGKATRNSDWFWTKIWHELVETIQEYLPDMDIAMNSMDESRLVVPWEEINERMQAERKSRKMPKPSKMKQAYSGVADIDKENNNERLNDVWESDLPYFPKARRGCPPDSLARKAEVMTDWTRSPVLSMQHAGPHSYRGYVSNWTLSTSICHQPDLQALHGYFIEPLTIKTSAHLMPLFGGSKLATNNEILLPAPMYWTHDERFEAIERGPPWEQKQDRMIWRGVATGGRNNKDNWKGFHRHRFVSMVNGSEVGRAESWEKLPLNFELPSRFYDLKSARNGHLGDWLNTFADVAFMNPNCWPLKEGVDRCDYIGDGQVAKEGMTMAQQFQSKYLPDIDGNSFSGRYRAFLQSNSLPIKATIFKEWHDSRIVPWKHFVPMDNRYQDIYGIMEYFLGYGGFEDDDENSKAWARDAAAKKIAMEGQAWAGKVLRSEDMQIYVFRLLLEYARVSDNERDRLGFVTDLKW